MKEKQNKDKGLIFIISGPSGSGKTTLLKGILQDNLLRRRLSRSVSVTTRPRRPGERRGKDYFFLPPAEFRRLNKAKKILEWTRYLGYYYGTQKDFLEAALREGRHLALCLDLKGALTLKRLYPDQAVTIFILPPSLKELQRRIEGRCRITHPEEVRSRLLLAQAELKQGKQYDYVVKNKNFVQAVKRLKEIILKEIRA